MSVRPNALAVGAAIVAMNASLLVAQASDSLAYLKWTREQAESSGRAMRADGRVGGVFDLRVVRTERSYNYKLRATWMTREVIRATARLAQLSQRLSDSETMTLVTEAEGAGDLIVMMEIDPREGSGVVPLDMIVLLQPKGEASDSDTAIRGTIVPGLRNTRALAGVFRRDYAYEQFWVVFDLNDDRGRALFAAHVDEVEFVVRIYDKEGRVSWPVPASMKI